MSQSVRDFEQHAVPLPITETARAIANQFAQNQPSVAKTESVRLNTLAVCAANDYFQMMGIPTQLESSDSWNPVMQMMSDVADLMLPELGQLECRPIKADASTCQVPPDVWDLRVGYLVVAVEEDLQTAKLLGFVPTVASEELPLAQLQPIEDLLDHLYELRQASAPAPAAVEAESRANPLLEAAVNLGQWLNGTFDAGWQTVEALLSPETLTPAFSFRGLEEEILPAPETADSNADVRRAKLVDLAVQLGHQQLVLIVEMQVESVQQTHIGLQVHPVGDQPYLPPRLELAVLEPTDAVFMQVQARQADNYIQLQFSGEPGERFKIRIQMDEAQYIEEFVI